MKLRILKAILRPAVALFLAVALHGCSNAPVVRADADPISLIPVPAQLERSPGYFLLHDGDRLIVRSGNANAQAIAHDFAHLLKRTRGINLDVRPLGDGSDTDGIVFALDPNLSIDGDEAYELSVSPHRILLSARTPHGLFNGSTTLWQLFTLDSTNSVPVKVPAVQIADAPHFAWRGLMLDSARHFQTVDDVKRLLDAMAQHKLNVFHWHLTDDQGWRIQIRKYPRLTEVGAWRLAASAATDTDTDAAGKQARRCGGYYTQDDIREVVRYAADRFITVVPEIEMPGHAQAAIASYPQLGSAGDQPRVSPDWGVHTYLYNTDEATFRFLEDVLGEVIELFPGPYVHIGGDEAAKDQWQASPRIQQQMKALGIANETALQSHFIHRIERFLSAHHRRLIGWDEILEGGLPPAATVMSWRGIKGAVEAAQQGHDVVLAPSPDLYLDHNQSSLHDEPPGRPQVISLADVYAFNPIPAVLTDEQSRHVLGAQANLWTEHMRTAQRVEHAAFPRAAALAEVLWSPRLSQDFGQFALRLPAQLERYRRLGIEFADSAYAVSITAQLDPSRSRVAARMSTQTGIGAIHYTLDGSVPTESSPTYRSALSLPASVVLQATAFLGHQALGAPRSLLVDPVSLLRKNSDELRLCREIVPLRLEDDTPLAGPRAVFRLDILDPCWIYPAAQLDTVNGIQARVGQLPFNFQLWHDVKGIVTHPPATASGELEVHLDTCSGELLAAISLQAASTQPALSTLSAALPQRNGVHDLCLQFTSRSPDPLWAIDSIQLLSGSVAN